MSVAVPLVHAPTPTSPQSQIVSDHVADQRGQDLRPVEVRGQRVRRGRDLRQDRDRQLEDWDPDTGQHLSSVEIHRMIVHS